MTTQGTMERIIGATPMATSHPQPPPNANAAPPIAINPIMMPVRRIRRERQIRWSIWRDVEHEFDEEEHCIVKFSVQVKVTPPPWFV
ncbi:hypothetical protein [Acidiphilium sp. 20-67-58]|uniref:hypothetical protein n=1 Tax=Acidiphilium sp. 20-67-58 TaxID=1970291 RepID=UPI0025B8C165|nr:hypothetical protein [Acidiphilium sp. 20-67-58]